MEWEVILLLTTMSIEVTVLVFFQLVLLRREGL